MILGVKFETYNILSYLSKSFLILINRNNLMPFIYCEQLLVFSEKIQYL